MSPQDWFIASMLCFVLLFLIATSYDMDSPDRNPIVDRAVAAVLYLLSFGCVGSLCMWLGSMFLKAACY